MFESRTVQEWNFHCDGPGISPCHPFRVYPISGMFEIILRRSSLNDNAVESSRKMLSWLTAAARSCELDKHVSLRLVGPCMSCTHWRHLTGGRNSAHQSAQRQSLVRWRRCVHDMHIPNSLVDMRSSSPRAPAQVAAVSHQSIFCEACSALSLRNLLEEFLRLRKEENLYGHCEMNNAWRFLSKGSTLWRGCWIWSKKLHFQKNFCRNFIAVEGVIFPRCRVKNWNWQLVIEMSGNLEFGI